ncbi:MAG: hypothetical protein ACPGU1_15870 [Myxococcota bacterium]
MRTMLWMTAAAILTMGCTGSGLGTELESTPPAPDTSAANFTDAAAAADIALPTAPFEDAGRSEADTSTTTEADTDAEFDTNNLTDAVAEESGNFGAPCEEDADCYSGLCVEHRGSTVCSKACEEDCPPGWSCEQISLSGSDQAFVCVSSFEHLCRPCLGADDCTSETSQTACVSYGDDGAFCGASCAEDGDCPDGFVCQESTSMRGGMSAQCVRDDALCACSTLAIELGLVTECSVTNEHGTCSALRACTADGLAPCEAAIPAAESCNGEDDNCNGDSDEGTPCDDGDPCTSDACLGADGCVHDIVLGAPCDDGDPNTLDDSCTTDGSCEGTPITCEEGPCVLQSSPVDGACVTVYKVAGVVCDDEDSSTHNDICDADGGCAGTPYTCTPGECEASATPDGVGCVTEPMAAGLACDDANPETKGDACDGAGSCVGEPYTCSAGPCEVSAIANGTDCEVTPKAAGTACDDGDLGTTQDNCDGAGTCVGTAFTCTPGLCDISATPNGVDCDIIHVAAGVQCSDGDPNTLDDQCDGAGACVGTALTCTPGLCETMSVAVGGVCVPTYALTGAPCDDSDLTTKADICDGAGHCGGAPYACVAGNCDQSAAHNGVDCDVVHIPSGALCSDGDPNTLNDACDGAGQCIGVTLTCEPGVCQSANVAIDGACVPTYSLSGSPCDDGDLGTKVDLCDGAGTCAGTPITCTPSVCDVSAVANGVGCDVIHFDAGTPCSDGDPNTLDDTCDGVGGCVGAALECAPDICQTASTPDGGVCVPTFAQQGAHCDDGDLTTAGDYCDGQGGCIGIAITCTPGPCDASSTPNGVDCDVVHYPEGASCSDDDLSTAGDSCDAFGVCAGTPFLCELGPCDTSSTPNGVDCDVVLKAAGATCDDDDLTTSTDLCDDQGGCQGTPILCEPGQCDISSTPNGVDCTVIPRPADLPCNDGDLTTAEDTCDGAGGCLGTPYTCPEPSPCTPNFTQDGEGCIPNYAGSGTSCDDTLNQTKNDQCNGSGACQGTPYTCADPTPCIPSFTQDGEGCVPEFAALGTACSDDIDTTKNDVCNDSGSCQGTPYDCPGTTACIPSFTQDGESCVPEFAAAGTACDDGNPATSSDVCDGAGGCAGETSNCSVGGGVLIPSSGFCDPSPPSGWAQCAGWINTSGDDVSDTALDGCLNSNNRLRIRVWHNGVLEEDVYSEDANVSSWQEWNYLGGSVTKLKSTNWTGSTTFFTTTGGGSACYHNFQCGIDAPCGTLTLGTGNGSTIILAPGATDSMEYRNNCGGQAFVGRTIALYR